MKLVRNVFSQYEVPSYSWFGRKVHILMVQENISQQDSELLVKEKVCVFWEIPILLMPR